MDKRRFLHTAASLLAATALSAPVVVQAAAKANLTQCFGIAKAGQNDCAGLSGLHSCKGTSDTSYNPGDFRVVPEGTCASLGGLSKTEAEAILKSPGRTQAFEAAMARRSS